MHLSGHGGHSRISSGGGTARKKADRLVFKLDGVSKDTRDRIADTIKKIKTDFPVDSFKGVTTVSERLGIKTEDEFYEWQEKNWDTLDFHDKQLYSDATFAAYDDRTGYIVINDMGVHREALIGSYPTRLESDKRFEGALVNNPNSARNFSGSAGSSLESLVEHEYAHSILYEMLSKEPSQVGAIYDYYNINRANVLNDLGSYAASHPHEMVPEAFAQYRSRFRTKTSEEIVDLVKEHLSQARKGVKYKQKLNPSVGSHSKK